jgi:hypothetical protein
VRGTDVALNRVQYEYAWVTPPDGWNNAAFFCADVDKQAGETVQFEVTANVIVAYMYDTRAGYNDAVPEGFTRLSTNIVGLWETPQ